MQNLYEPRFSSNQNNRISEMPLKDILSPRNKKTEALLPRATSSIDDNEIDKMSLNSMNQLQAEDEIEKQLT